MNPPAAEARIRSFHAHVYFGDATERKRAEALRARLDERFAVQLGRWHEVPVGPHTRPMFQVAFAPDLFGALVPELMLHRDSLTVLVHPNTLAPHADHLQHALWLGTPLPLKESVLPLRIDAADQSPVIANTTARA